MKADTTIITLGRRAWNIFGNQLSTLALFFFRLNFVLQSQYTVVTLYPIVMFFEGSHETQQPEKHNIQENKKSAHKIPICWGNTLLFTCQTVLQELSICASAMQHVDKLCILHVQFPFDCVYSIYSRNDPLPEQLQLKLNFSSSHNEGTISIGNGEPSEYSSCKNAMASTRA